MEVRQGPCLDIAWQLRPLLIFHFDQLLEVWLSFHIASPSLSRKHNIVIVCVFRICAIWLLLLILKTSFSLLQNLFVKKYVLQMDDLVTHKYSQSFLGSNRPGQIGQPMTDDVTYWAGNLEEIGSFYWQKMQFLKDAKKLDSLPPPFGNVQKKSLFVFRKNSLRSTSPIYFSRGVKKTTRGRFCLLRLRFFINIFSGLAPSTYL